MHLVHLYKILIKLKSFLHSTIYRYTYIYIYIYIYILAAFLVDTNFIKHNRHFMSTYFLLDPFEFPYYFYCIWGALIYVLSIVVCIPSTFCPTLGHHQGRIYYKSDVTFVLAYYEKIQKKKKYVNQLIGLVGRVFANCPGDLGSISGRVIRKTLKMVLDTSLLNTQHYKVSIKGKVEQSRKRSSALPYTSV